MFKIRFDPQKIKYWVSRYEGPHEDLIQAIGTRMKSKGYLTKKDFVALCHWKSPRNIRRVRNNEPQFIRAVTETALSTSDERLRISVLTLLHGVSWPTASVILHFGHQDQYPILDFRALWSLSTDEPSTGYNFDFWWAYTLKCRQIAREYKVSMRTLDNALWQYSKENQGVADR